MTVTKTRRESVYQREVRRARDQFKSAVASGSNATTGKEWPAHQMTVLLDQAPKEPYRHIRFAKPGTVLWSWSLVTWPGHLAISGDLHSFTFRRLHDMFDFFTGEVNPGYWSEKLVAGTAETRYSRERFLESVKDHVEGLEDDFATRREFRAYRAAVEEELLDSPPEYLEEAHQRLNDFEHEGRRFYDIWEWDLGGYDHQFLVALHAIRFGVARYRAEYPDKVIREVP